MKTFDYWDDLQAINKQIDIALENKPILENSAALDWYEKVLDLMEKRVVILLNMIHEQSVRIECFGVDVEHNLPKQEI